MLDYLRKDFKLINSLIKLVAFLLILNQNSCSPKRLGDTVIIAGAGKVKTIDPAQATTLRSLQLINALGDTLYGFDEKGNLTPQLASDLPIVKDNGLTIDIPLKKNIYFHDGTVFDSYAMRFSLERFMRIGTDSYLIKERVRSIESPNKFLIRLHLKRKSSSLIKLLSSVNLSPVSPKAYKNNQNDYINKNFIGTGPYKLISFSPDKQRIEPFSKYWGEKPKNKGIDYVSFNSSSSLFGAMRTGEVDILLSNSLEDIQILALNRLAQAGKLKETKGPAIEIGYITLKTNSEPFNKTSIREAIAYSINRNLITQKVSFGLRDPLRSIIPIALKKEKVFTWPGHDPMKTRSLLKKEGYCKNKKLIIPFTYRSNVPADKLLALTWKEQLKNELDDCLELELNGIESTTVYEQLSKGSYPAVMLDWTGQFPDPEAYIAPLLRCNLLVEKVCKEGEAVISGSFWGDPDIQVGLNESESLTGEKRLKKILEIEELAAKGYPYIPIWMVKPRAWSQLNIDNMKFNKRGQIDLKSIQRDNK